MKNVKRFLAVLLFSILVCGTISSAASWKSFSIGSASTKYYVSNTFESSGDVLWELRVNQNTSTVAYQADFATVELQRLDAFGNWVVADTFNKTLFKGSTTATTLFGTNSKNWGGTCRLVFSSDKTVKISGTIKYFN